MQRVRVNVCILESHSTSQCPPPVHSPLHCSLSHLSKHHLITAHNSNLQTTCPALSHTLTPVTRLSQPLLPASQSLAMAEPMHIVDVEPIIRPQPNSTSPARAQIVAGQVSHRLIATVLLPIYNNEFAPPTPPSLIPLPYDETTSAERCALLELKAWATLGLTARCYFLLKVLDIFNILADPVRCLDPETTEQVLRQELKRLNFDSQEPARLGRELVIVHYCFADEKKRVWCLKQNTQTIAQTITNTFLEQSPTNLARLIDMLQATGKRVTQQSIRDCMKEVCGLAQLAPESPSSLSPAELKERQDDLRAEEEATSVHLKARVDLIERAEADLQLGCRRKPPATLRHEKRADQERADRPQFEREDSEPASLTQGASTRSKT